MSTKVRDGEKLNRIGMMGSESFSHIYPIFQRETRKGGRDKERERELMLNTKEREKGEVGW